MKVVLIEDSIPLRERFRALINAIDGAQMVGEAGSEDEALALIAQIQPDVVLLDLWLSTGSGLAVLKQVKTAWPTIKVAVLTSHAQSHYRERSMEFGAERFYDKQKDIQACLGQLSDWAAASPGEAESASARLANGTPLPSDQRRRGHPVLDHATAHLLNGGPHVTVVVDAQGRICGCGAAFEDLFVARSQSHLLGRRISELVVGILFDGNSPGDDGRQFLRLCSAGCWQHFEAIDGHGQIFPLEVHAMRRITGEQEVFVLNLRREQESLCP